MRSPGSGHPGRIALKQRLAAERVFSFVTHCCAKFLESSYDAGRRTVRNCERGIVARTSVLLFLSCLVASAQQPGQPAANQAASVPSEWDARTDIASLVAGVRRLKPLLDKVTPEEWIKEGAPQAWVQQLRSAKSSIDYLAGSAEQLAQKPENMPAAIETYFRLEATETIVNSVREGLRKYQSPDLAKMIGDVMQENSINREKFKAYIVDLANLRSQEFDIMNQEAQRCRDTVMRTTIAPGNSTPRRSSSK